MTTNSTRAITAATPTVSVSSFHPNSPLDPGAEGSSVSAADTSPSPASTSSELRSAEMPRALTPRLRDCPNAKTPRTTGTLRTCLLYTSDAADDLLCVDLGG